MIKGTVQFTGTKTTTKAGKPLRTPLYSFKVNDVWYSCGFENPKVNQGDVVEFNYEDSAYGPQVDVDTVKVVGSEPSTSTSSGSTGGYDRQASIVYQSSRTAAIEITKLALQYDILTLPKAKNKQLETLLDYVEELTNDFAAAAINPTIREPSNEETAVKEEEGDSDDE